MHPSAAVISRRRSRTLALAAFGLAVSAGCAYLAVRDVRLHEVWDGLRASDYWWTIPSVALLFAAQAVRAWRWQFLFERVTRPPYRPLLDATLVGQAFNNLLPARAGEAVRVVALHRAAGTSRAEAAATVLVERVFDVLVLLAMLFVAVPWLPHVTWLRAAAVLAIALAAATAASALVLARFGERPFVALLRPAGRLPFLSTERVEAAAASFVRGAASLRDPRLALAAGALTVISWLILAASSWVLMYAFEVTRSPLAGLLATIATGLSLVLPASPGAVGVFEAAALLALTAYGVSRTQALPYALVLHAVNLFPYVAAGVVILLLGRGARIRS